jgi:cytochrome c peroxidase
MKPSSKRIAACLLLAGTFLLMSGRPDSPLTPDPTPYQLEYPAYFGHRYRIPEDNPTTEEGVELGRRLFYETALSANGQLSCAACHRQELAFTDGRAFSPGVDGSLTHRNSMSLANLLWVRNLFWDGRSPSLEAQAEIPLTDAHEMGQSLEISSAKLQSTALYPELFRRAFGTESITGNLIVKAIAQFERTLISSDAPYDRYLQGTYELTAREKRGMDLFMRPADPTKNIRGANCGHCHGTPKTFIELFHNNGLDVLPKDPGREALSGYAADRGRFRVPTLRNIALTAPYMHDGRFQSLAEVLDHYNDHLQDRLNVSTFLTGRTNEEGGKSLGLTTSEKEDIIAFLHTLTDSTFITNPAFSDPNL